MSQCHNVNKRYEMKYVAYYRVSTQKQGVSGLGLEVQKQSVMNFVSGGELVKEFTEIESGKKNDRIQLNAAIEYCSKHACILIIAKLDRLSRNASFIFALRDAGIQFICCDMPDANPLTIGIFAVLAQHERETISKRTKDALKIAKERGVKLGTPNNLTYEDRVKGAQIRKENALKNSATERAFCLISTLRKTGESFGSIAKILNENSFKTARGGAFSTTQVIRIVSMYC